jgi:hypothetical protein
MSDPFISGSCATTSRHRLDWRYRKRWPECKTAADIRGNPEERPDTSSRKQVQQEASVMVQEPAWAE